MDFGFTLAGLPVDGIVCWDRHRAGGLDVQGTERLRLVIDTFGRNSCKSQGLPAVITDLFRLQTSDHRLYLAISQKAGRLTVFGGIKTGRKRLFIRVETGAFCEIEPVCVLDFYVHEDFQRQGLGKHLFEHFLAMEQQAAASLGYDRPSPKLLTFLRKHYGLAQYIPQSNSFVVFSAYFQNAGLQQAPDASPWTSVSQRPLTAKKRHLHSARHANGLASDSIAPRRLSGARLDHNTMAAAATGYGYAGPSSIPAFRTATNRGQPMQSPSQTCSQQAGLGCAEQSLNALSNQPSWQAQSQNHQKHSLTPQQASNTASQLRDSSSEWQSSSADTARSNNNQLQQAELLPSTQRQAYSASTGRSLEHQSSSKAASQGPSQHHAAAGQIYNRSRAASHDICQGGQAGAMAAKPVMYVKPPWAIDDPYQAVSPGPRMQASWDPPTAAPPAKSASPWSQQAAAGRQRAGAGARDCLIW